MEPTDLKTSTFLMIPFFEYDVWASDVKAAFRNMIYLETFFKTRKHNKKISLTESE